MYNCYAKLIKTLWSKKSGKFNLKMFQYLQTKICSRNPKCFNTPILYTTVVLVLCNIVSNDYQQDSRVLYMFIANKSLGQLLDIFSKNFIFLKIFSSEFSYIEVWFSDQNLK